MSEAHAIRIGNMAAPAIGTTPTNITAAATTAAATAARGEQPGPGANVVARRRADACATCHHKKIRCDLDPSAYRPCSSCASLGIPCRRRQRKPYTYAALRFLRFLLSLGTLRTTDSHLSTAHARIAPRLLGRPALLQTSLPAITILVLPHLLLITHVTILLEIVSVLA